MECEYGKKKRSRHIEWKIKIKTTDNNRELEPLTNQRKIKCKQKKRTLYKQKKNSKNIFLAL